MAHSKFGHRLQLDWIGFCYQQCESVPVVRLSLSCSSSLYSSGSPCEDKKIHAA